MVEKWASIFTEYHETFCSYYTSKRDCNKCSTTVLLWREYSKTEIIFQVPLTSAWLLTEQSWSEFVFWHTEKRSSEDKQMFNYFSFILFVRKELVTMPYLSIKYSQSQLSYRKSLPLSHSTLVISLWGQRYMNQVVQKSDTQYEL